MYQELLNTIAEYNALNLEQVIDYERFCMISIVWHSTKIEGCSLSETDTQVLIDKDITAAGKPLYDHLMVKDHFAAFEYIKQKAKEKAKFTPELIKEIGALIMKNTGAITNTILGSFDSSKGDFRLEQVYVDKKYFPDSKKVPMLIDKFCSTINEKIDNLNNEEIIKLAADSHYNFINIHPFGDGNGRTGRMLMNYIQLYHNQPLIKIFTEDRVAYINALNDTEAEENLDIFRKFVVEQQLKYLKIEIEKYKKLNNKFTFLF